jgi:hypothetical protein
MGFKPDPENKGRKTKAGCAHVSGFSLYANVGISAKARHQLENLCRYVARPAVATERLSLLPDGRVSYRLRHEWTGGTSHVLFEPLKLVEKLAALVPPPRFNLVSSRVPNSRRLFVKRQALILRPARHRFFP